MLDAVKVPGSPVSWIATCIKLVTITMVVSMMELVMALQKEVLPGGPWRRPVSL